MFRRQLIQRGMDALSILGGELRFVLFGGDRLLDERAGSRPALPQVAQCPIRAMR